MRYIHIIMPIGFDPIYAEKKLALYATISRFGLKANFPSYCFEWPKFDLSEMIGEIERAEAVFADLSYERPSCYYELGVAEVLRKPVYLVASAGTPIHQCAGRHTVQYYKNLPALYKIVERALVQIRGGGKNI